MQKQDTKLHAVGPAPEQRPTQEFQLTPEERSSLALIIGKIELAQEKGKVAAELHTVAQMMKAEWMKAAANSRNVPPNSELNANPATGIITVMLPVEAPPAQEKSP